MSISGNDIVYVLSGGSNNADPNKSLGGNPSSHFILGTINNLFDDVTQEEVNAGQIDYRCFYIFNDSATDTLYGSQLYVPSQVASGSDITVGLLSGNDVQAINILGTVTGGTYDVQYDTEPALTIAHDPDAAVWGQNLQTALRTLPNLGGVTVSVGVYVGAVAFQVNFVGTASNRNHPLLVITASTLTGVGVTFNVNKVVDGGPINSIAHAIDVSTTPPTGINFGFPTHASPILVGDLRPTEGFAVWIKRTTPVAASPLANDGFTIRLAGFATP
jgi:hypothetical protein